MKLSDDVTRHQRYAELRGLMVADQLVRRGIRDERVLRAMRSVPRHFFVEEDQIDRAYEDHALPIGDGQTISQPYMVALMTEALGVSEGDKVLEIGTGSGYQAAILAEMGVRVFTIERVEPLARRAERVLRGLGYADVSIRVSDGTLGWPEEAPFQGVIVTAGSPSIPENLVAQLAPGGRIVIPVGERHSQDLIRGIKTPEGLATRNLLPCVFVPLLGQFGWKNGNPDP